MKGRKATRVRADSNQLLNAEIKAKAYHLFKASATLVPLHHGITLRRGIKCTLSASTLKAILTARVKKGRKRQRNKKQCRHIQKQDAIKGYDVLKLKFSRLRQSSSNNVHL